MGRDPATGALPPWEQREAGQVPFVEASSPAMSDTELRTLPDLWAIRSAEGTARGPHTRQPSIPRAYTTPATMEHRLKPRYGSVDRTGTSSPPEARPSPYETQVYIPPGPATAPPLKRSMAPLDAPLTPSDSLNYSFSSSSTDAAESAATALPGTMSSRSRQASRSRSRAADRQRSTSKQPETESVGLSRRFKSAIKDMFKRDPIDESQFERIEDRHWTDEY